jgi:D-alanyl-lipoteichoic acid acyltransferase DltB (MBOAT superfamily)
MSFVGIEFLFFYPLIIFLFYSIPRSYRWLLLLPASLFFFLYLNVVHGILLFFVIVISYVIALFSDNKEIPESSYFHFFIHKRFLLYFILMGLLLSIFPLLYFKYSSFLSITLAKVIYKLFGLSLSIELKEKVLPLGISFFTLQAVGYVIDVYRKQVEPERNFFRYTLFICFFPQLVAGPIERFSNMIVQLKSPKLYSYNRFSEGLKIFSWGLFKKVVVADNLGLIADPIFNSPKEFSPEILIIGALAFTFQIYGDFSGYSDMAIGIGKTLGIDLMKNFRTPYFSTSIPEF